ncbi:MAG: DEAD/DEAH box helicase, partial [Candidatus Magasanikbacteria bacterium]
MSFGESSHRIFQPKSPEELETQVEDSESFWEQSLIPADHNEDTKEIMQMSVEKLKKTYLVRYEMYLKSLRESKKVGKNEQENLDAKEIKAMKMRLRMLNNLDEYIHNISNGEKETRLREHQVTTFEKLRNYLEIGRTFGYIELPTGTGKTVIFIEFLRILDVPSIIVVPTKDLVKQTKARLKQFAKNLDVGAVYGKAKEYGSKVLVTTYDSLPKLLDHEKFDLDELGLAILDEVHESLSEKRSEVIERLKEKSIVIGFTATSEYSEDKNVANLLGEEIHEMSLPEAIESGALSACSAVVATTEVDISKVKIKSNGECDEEELDKAINVKARNKAVTELATITFVGKQKILFCGSVDHCRELADRINKAGEVAEVVVGETQDKVEEKYKKMGFEEGWKEAYEKRVIKAVLSVDLLTRGTDLPSAEICMNVFPTASLVKATQRGGRVTRLDPNNPNKHAIVVDFLDLGQSETYLGNSILFYKILGGTTVVPRSSESDSNGKLIKNNVDIEKRKGSFFDGQIIIEGLKVFVSLDEMERLVHREKETEEKIMETYRQIVKEQISVEDFCGMKSGTGSERKNFKITYNNDSISLVILSRIFGIEGNPTQNTEVHIALARAIYGEDEVARLLEKNNSLETYRQIVKEQISVEDFCGMKKQERHEFKIIYNRDIKGLVALSRIFGIKGNPRGYNEVLFALARAIYGEDEVARVLEKNNFPETYRQIVKEQISVEDFCGMKSGSERNNFKITYNNDSISLIVLSRIFGIKGNPMGYTEVLLALARAIYGEDEVARVLEKNN